ncbi:uncharacterized protein B0I36DRAFT_309152 [Microdochium trichocladiopsis]|uniref:WSC domain-containing protein n=1 Tax=Microdochium trichocladiopsis TaxID=1682393 RepID=A0A9P9BT86_9PEZI|nr:uncharacterized protein B0I36DRAFT_309152 [Microdochium trichocladiopsis]KAH7039716.1 hypothetical protein B0I36DRAFT_309152 [Microdochium trichocladiopsis]
MTGNTRLALAVLASASTLLIAPVPVEAGAGGWPEYQWDPETIPTCTTWQEPDENQTCEQFRAYWGLTAEDFNTYNPSVGVDCKGWYWQQSYCISDAKRDADYIATATDPFWVSLVSSLPTPTPGTPTHVVEGTPIPSPWLWKPYSCYPTGPDPFANKILDQQISKGDKSMTVQNCRARCWDLLPSKTITFMGMRNGDECWCGPHLMSPADYHYSGWGSCNSTCSGNEKQKSCGGKEHMAVWGAVVLYGKGPFPSVSAAASSGIQPTAATTTGSSQNSAKRTTGSAWAGELLSCAMAVLTLWT